MIIAYYPHARNRYNGIQHFLYDVLGYSHEADACRQIQDACRGGPTCSLWLVPGTERD
jgi:hypothetical protein